MSRRSGAGAGAGAGAGGFYGRRSGQATRQSAASNPTTPNIPGNAPLPPRRFEYRPGMFLEDRPPLVSPAESGSDLDYGEEFSFRDPSPNSFGPTLSPAYEQQPNNAPLFQTPVANRVPTSNRQIILLLQQQQAALKEVLDCQKKSNERQSNIEHELHDLQAKVDGISSQCSMDSEVDKKRKRVVTRSLSVSSVIICMKQ